MMWSYARRPFSQVWIRRSGRKRWEVRVHPTHLAVAAPLHNVRVQNAMKPQLSIHSIRFAVFSRGIYRKYGWLRPGVGPGVGACAGQRCIAAADRLDGAGPASDSHHEFAGVDNPRCPASEASFDVAANDARGDERMPLVAGAWQRAAGNALSHCK